MQVIAEASVAMQPLNGLTSLAQRTSQATGVAASVAIEQDIPDDPQPLAPEPREQIAQQETVNEKVWEAAPIVIHEDDPMPHEAMVPAARENLDPNAVPGQEIPPNGCPIVMPLCQDEDESPVTPPRMPFAEANDHKPVPSHTKKTGGSSEEAESSAFKEWMKFFKEDKGKKEDKPSTVEELPPPTEEEPQSDGKCQEDSHRNEQYPGCPRVTCPYSSKDTREQYFKRVWDLDPKMNKKGKEEASEEPPQPDRKPHDHKESKDKEQPLRTKGVDTMEYRPSDGGLNEYGPGPLQ
jgi:hypothetical protein